MAAILAPSPHHPVVGDRRPDLRLVPGGAAGRPDLAAAHRRRRVVAGLLAVLVLTGILSGSRALLAPLAEPASAGPAAPAAATAGSVSVVVEPGDTLWTIARRVQPDGDIRPLVDQLVATSGSGPLQPGDHITIPR
jgi:LysM domain-containing protein